MAHVMAPRRDMAGKERMRLAKLSTTGSRSDTPDVLEIRQIKEMPNVFQPRFDSIWFAPGRSEGHVADLAKIPKAGRSLDPVTVMAFGQHWVLVDGHHRMAAYKEAGGPKAVPVVVLRSDLRGKDRVEWAKIGRAHV